MKLEAYRVTDTPMPIVPARRRREWMDRTVGRNANRCLPLHIANQSGWWILNHEKIEVQYFGGKHQTLLEARKYNTEERASAASSHFGHGIVTFSIPYLFRTPPGWNLHVKGPSNYIIEGAQALEGVVETDWSPMTFTMNWQITQELEPVVFDVGDPICQIVPVRRGELEQFSCGWGTDEETISMHTAWTERREEFLHDLLAEKPDALKQGWQKEYFQGMAGDEKFPGHQTKLHLQSFPDES